MTTDTTPYDSGEEWQDAAKSRSFKPNDYAARRHRAARASPRRPTAPAPTQQQAAQQKKEINQ